jgi:hypothetical protein
MTRRVIWIGLGLVTATILGLFVAQSGSPIRTSATIGGASLLDDDRIEVYLDCGSGVVWDVDESPDWVVADVRMFHGPGDCSAGAIIELAEPLGDRPLIDGATGDEVEVANR